MLFFIPLAASDRTLCPHLFLVDLRSVTMERTYIMIKPDGVQRNLVGEIIARFEKKGYKLAALKVCSDSRLEPSSCDGTLLST